MTTKTIILTFFILGQLKSHSQTLNTVDKVKLTLPCKLEMVYNENSTKSFVCQTFSNNIPVSYRVTIEDFSSTLQEFDEKGKRIFIETYLNKIKNDAEPKSRNVKSKTFYNLMAIQFDNFVDMGDMALQSRTFVFFYKYKSISFNYVSSISSFDNRFTKF